MKSAEKIIRTLLVILMIGATLGILMGAYWHIFTLAATSALWGVMRIEAKKEEEQEKNRNI